MAKKAKKTARGRKQDRCSCRGRARLRGSIHGQKNRPIESCREEGWLGAKARREPVGALVLASLVRSLRNFKFELCP